MTQQPSHPLELSTAEMRRLISEAADRIVRHIETLPDQAAADVEGGAELARSLVEEVPTEGEPFTELLDLLFERVRAPQRAKQRQLGLEPVVEVDDGDPREDPVAPGHAAPGVVREQRVLGAFTVPDWVARVHPVRWPRVCSQRSCWQFRPEAMVERGGRLPRPPLA